MGFKFKKGSRVEVWNQLEKPLGSWCCAEIVSGNGRYYHVRYDRDPLDDQAVVKRVPRKAMRPCPPVKSRESWVPGDIVEVFDNSSWKLVEVCGVVGESYYLVRLRGSFSELTAHSSELRLQQCWQDDKWIVIDKDLVISGSGVINKISKEGKLSYQMLQPRPEVKKCNVGCHFPTKDGNDAKGLHWDLSRGINGKLHVSSPLAESYTEARKSRAIEGDGNRRRLVSQHAPKLLEKGQCWRLVKLASTGPNDGWDLSPILHFGLWHHFHLILRNGNHLALEMGRRRIGSEHRRRRHPGSEKLHANSSRNLTLPPASYQNTHLSLSLSLSLSHFCYFIYLFYFCLMKQACSSMIADRNPLQHAPNPMRFVNNSSWHQKIN